LEKSLSAYRTPPIAKKAVRLLAQIDEVKRRLNQLRDQSEDATECAVVKLMTARCTIGI
jgi:hypothetical protein